MRLLTCFLASFFMGSLIVGLGAFAFMFYKGMILEAFLVSAVSTLVGYIIMMEKLKGGN